ncbi:MAG TPA: penicillin-binding protein 1C [Vicinamibacterales bacterium]|nr:penicillin-binding protein 1C [Vicinamibacterales bacterium]
MTSRAARRLHPGHRRRILVVTTVLIAAVACWIRMGPLPAGLLEADAPSTLIVDRHGEVLYETRTVAGTRGADLRADDVPAVLAEATLAAEDHRFLWHPGLDPIAIGRATLRNLRAGAVVEGGSTITQQVAQLLIARQHGGRAPRGWWAQAREAALALRLEHRQSKAAILSLYLNLAPYGNQIAGASRAAEAYFGRGVETLTPAEAAFLAALPQQPSRFNPWKDASAARARQQRILDAMVARGSLSEAARATAREETLSLVNDRPEAIAPHFVERVRADVDVSGRPVRVETTIDAGLQRIVRGIIAANRATLDAHHARNVAVAVLDNRTGEWLAWEGSGDYFDTDHGGAIDGVVAPRQPGSALKPFTYAAAFERGFHPGSVLADVPAEFPTAVEGVLYRPQNYDGQFRGPLRARDALAGSENVPAVVLASAVGVPALARLLRQAGLSTLDRTASHYGLGLTLGNAEVRLDELVAAYAMFARGGTRVAPRRVRAVDGRAEAGSAAAERVVSERTAFWVTDVLADDDARAYIFGRGGSLEFPFPVAAKTGTSQAYHDNWALGYTADVTVGVWVGNFDRTPLRQSSGVTGAGPIFHDVLLAAVERVRGRLPIGAWMPVAGPPPEAAPVELCAVSGLAPHGACLRRITEWLPAGAPPESCTWHRDTGHGVETIWPDAYRHWARDRGLATAASSPARPVPRRAAADPVSRFRVVAPLAGALYLIDPTLRPDFQAVPLRAAGAAPGRVEWFVNGELVGVASSDEVLRWPIVRGLHAIRARDAAGQTAETTITVR